MFNIHWNLLWNGILNFDSALVVGGAEHIVIQTYTYPRIEAKGDYRTVSRPQLRLGAAALADQYRQLRICFLQFLVILLDKRPVTSNKIKFGEMDEDRPNSKSTQ
ncbi:hypothetical protein LXL04_003783 [Taraxacum kok-saghyz]